MNLEEKVWKLAENLGYTTPRAINAIRSALSEGYRMGLEEAAEKIWAQSTPHDSDFTRGIVEGRNYAAAELRRLAQEGK